MKIKLFIISYIFVSLLFFPPRVVFAATACCDGGWSYIDKTTNPNYARCSKGLFFKDNNCGGFLCKKSGAFGLGTWECDVIPIPASLGVPDYSPCKNMTGTLKDKCIACVGEKIVPASGVFPKIIPAHLNCDARWQPECGTWTSLGCIPNEPYKLTGWIISFATGIAGGIAMLLIIYGAFQIIMSKGIPEKIELGKETITSAIIGLVFIFVSILILRIIGVQILGIPGWK